MLEQLFKQQGMGHQQGMGQQGGQKQQQMAQYMNQHIKEQDLRRIAEDTPYEIRSTMDISYLGPTTYNHLLTSDYDKQFKQTLSDVGFDKFNDQIFMFKGKIRPENVDWEFWKHPIEIHDFIKKMDNEVGMMNAHRARIFETGPKVTQLHNRVKGVKNWSQREVPLLLEYLNTTLNHPFLGKSKDVLTFVEHCVPINRWNLKVYQQVQLTKKQNCVEEKMTDKAPVIGYLTVTGDGILSSKRNLLETKIDKMVPFTNQFRFQVDSQTDKDIVITTQSCQHQKLRNNFKKNYLGAVNFYIGFKKALRDAEVFDKNRRFKSFSKQRQNCWTYLYNDGHQYFSDLCDQLNKAKHQILITDWWLTPFFLLKRPDNITRKVNRLDGILKKLADRGVKIWIIIFREPLNILCNDSQQTHFYLESLSRNIRVRRHPIVPQLWSHHQKCCIIDQTVGFMGGLDICFGRWDTPQHSLWNKDDKWNGGDYTNQRLRAFTPGTTHDYTKSPLDRDSEPRMPWHDIGLQVRGDAVIDMTRHFVQYWYYVDNQKSKDPVQMVRNLGKRFQRSYNYVEPDWQGDQENPTWQTQEQQEPRAQSFGQKMSMFGKRTKLFITGPQRRLPQLLIQVNQGSRAGDMQLQLCRSASPWSIGANQTQDSIHRAYQQLIFESESFIYIQNQFFMGKKNKIVECLAQRIRRAHLNRQNFKVVVVMPLLPGFQGDIANQKDTALRIQVHNQFYSINRSEFSLHYRLRDLPNFNINQYIFFFGLRTHAICGNRPITEIIYIHSKLMITDDKRAIIGSANINDRSLLGDRDSELAMIIEQDNGKIQDGKPRRQHIFDLRCRLFDEHFGLTPEETANINSPQIWSKIITNAKNNTLIYRQIFQCYPDDNITVSQEVTQKLFEAQPHLYHELTPKIIGHAVEFPLKFMSDEDLQSQNLSAQQMAGQELFL